MVELREITRENYEECLNLKLADNQKNFVSSNAHSLAQAWIYYKTAFPFAVYADNIMIGFIMFGYYEMKGYYTLWKFMIDEKYQNKGYGKKALKLGIDYLVNRFKVREIYTAYHSTNHIARNLYASFGFRETGEVAGSEVGMKLIVNDLGNVEHLKNIIVSFSGRRNGNCDRIAEYIFSKDDLILFMRDISVQPCADCDYECMSGRCKYHSDGIYSFFEKIPLADKVFFIVPMYCGNPSALYFIMNERCQDYFMHNESHYEKMVDKLYIIGVYGNAEDYPDFLNTFARQYDFENVEKHVLGLERHKYDQKMKDFLLDEDDVKVKLNEFIGR